MGVGDESTFLQKNLIGRAIWERKYLIGIAQYKDGVELELMKYSLPSSRIYYTEFGLFTMLFCSVTRFCNTAHMLSTFYLGVELPRIKLC